MRIFLSWSGETSRALADVLRQWLPSVIQASRPYFSPDDVTKGTRWSSEIAHELNDSRLGLICLTKDNLEAAWIMFEAGALSKNIGASRVIPLLFNVDPSELVGPMTQFQAAQFSEDEVRRVVLAINSELGDSRLAPEVVQDVFEMWWPRLQERVAGVLANATTTTATPVRSEKDILDEVLALTRSMSRSRAGSDLDGIVPGAVDDLLVNARRLLSALASPHINYTTELREALDGLQRPLVYIAGRQGRSSRSAKAGVPTRADFDEAFATVRKAMGDDEDLPF